VAHRPASGVLDTRTYIDLDHGRILGHRHTLMQLSHRAPDDRGDAFRSSIRLMKSVGFGSDCHVQADHSQKVPEHVDSIRGDIFRVLEGSFVVAHGQLIERFDLT
jgi:hypothetical protein